MKWWQVLGLGEYEATAQVQVAAALSHCRANASDPRIGLQAEVRGSNTAMLVPNCSAALKFSFYFISPVTSSKLNTVYFSFHSGEDGTIDCEV